MTNRQKLWIGKESPADGFSRIKEEHLLLWHKMTRGKSALYHEVCLDEHAIIGRLAWLVSFIKDGIS